jgi:hypothetical protein
MLLVATILITVLLAVPAMSVELFRYRGAAKDGGTLEYVFDAGERNSPNALTKEKAAEIAADFMTTFITYRLEHWKRRNFGQRPSPSGSSVFRTRSKTYAPDVFRRSAAGWDGGCAESGADVGA